MVALYRTHVLSTHMGSLIPRHIQSSPLSPLLFACVTSPSLLHRTEFCNKASTPTNLGHSDSGAPWSRPKIRPINKVAQAPLQDVGTWSKINGPHGSHSPKNENTLFSFSLPLPPLWLLDGGPNRAHLTRGRHPYGRPAVSDPMNGPDPRSDHPAGPTSHTLPHGLRPGTCDRSGPLWVIQWVDSNATQSPISIIKALNIITRASMGFYMHKHANKGRIRVLNLQIMVKYLLEVCGWGRRFRISIAKAYVISQRIVGRERERERERESCVGE